jgi:hypothetical protein
MSIQPNFGNAELLVTPKPPIVLRLEGLHPKDLGKFEMHDARTGGDLSHVDLEASERNEVLHCEPNWRETLQAEIANARCNNFNEQAEALRKKSRKAELEALKVQGESDPWRRCRGGGPLREGILTVNKGWLGGTGHAEWDPAQVALFRAAALAFLLAQFPDGQLRYASAHHDEEAFHIHFVVAVWTEKTTDNRGRQVLLQASTNPILEDYEHAQDLAGAAFEPLGITRGQRHAEARRLAKAAGAEIPKKPRHIPPSAWRASQLELGQEQAKEKSKDLIVQALAAAKVVTDAARSTGEVVIHKSRKRAIKEAKKRRDALAREGAVAERQRQEAERAADAARTACADSEAKRAILEIEAADTLRNAKEAAAQLVQITEEAVVAAEELQGVKAEIGTAVLARDCVQAEVTEASFKKEQIIEAVTEQSQELDRLRALSEKEGQILSQTSAQVAAQQAAHSAAYKARAEAEVKCILIQADTADTIRTAHAAAARLEQTKAEAVVASATLQAVKVEIGAAELVRDRVHADVTEASLKKGAIIETVEAQSQELDRLRALSEKEGQILSKTSAQVVELKAMKATEEQAWRDGVARKQAVESELTKLDALVVEAETKLSATKAMMQALTLGIEMLGNSVLRWILAPNPSDEKLDWGPNAPKSKEQIGALVAQIRPGFTALRPLARLISRTIDGILAKERKALAADAAFVLDMRADLDAAQQAELVRIQRAGGGEEPEVPGW